MAKIITSVIVPTIVGTINGSVFKRTPYGLSLGMKSNGYSKNKLLSNNSLGVLRAVRNLYNIMDTTDKEKWDDVAAVTPFIDKLGKTIFLTGRMLFIKVNSPLFIPKATYTDASLFTKDMAYFVIEDFVINLGSETATVKIDYNDVEAFFFISFEFGKKAMNLPVFNRRKIMERFKIAVPTYIDVYSALIKNFPYIEIGDVVRIYVTPCNVAGYQSTTLQLTTTITYKKVS